MHRRSFLFAGLAISHFLVARETFAQAGPAPLKPGDILPPLAGQALTGKSLDVALGLAGSPAVVIFSFSRAGGRDAQRWIERLQKHEPGLAIYTIIFLESVPGLFRGMAVSGIKAGMPSAMQARTLLLYRDEDLWKNRLQSTNEGQACLTLIRPSGQIEWMTSGPLSDAAYAEFTRSIQAPK
jgi:hypothetical protein